MTAKLDVHPVAALFPMLDDDELKELAFDIADRGLLQPIVLDAEGRVLDGRNRLAACKIAKVKPTFVTYEGDDADGYALAVNITRRHLTTGARAIIAAQAARLNGHGARKAVANVPDLAHQRITDAFTVLDWAPALAGAVIAGAKPLSVAVDEARTEKRNAEALEAKLTRLRDSAPDLRSLVDEERMGVDDAIAALVARQEKARTEEQERERKRADDRRDARALLTRIVDLAAPPSMSDGFVGVWADHIGDASDTDLKARAERAGRVLLDLAERIKT